jgi:hypothetical protein
MHAYTHVARARRRRHEHNHRTDRTGPLWHVRAAGTPVREENADGEASSPRAAHLACACTTEQPKGVAIDQPSARQPAAQPPKLRLQRMQQTLDRASRLPPWALPSEMRGAVCLPAARRMVCRPQASRRDVLVPVGRVGARPVRHRVHHRRVPSRGAAATPRDLALKWECGTGPRDLAVRRRLSLGFSSGSIDRSRRGEAARGGALGSPPLLAANPRTRGSGAGWTDTLHVTRVLLVLLLTDGWY